MRPKIRSLADQLGRVRQERDPGADHIQVDLMLPVQGRVFASQGKKALCDFPDHRIDAEDIAVLGAPDVGRLQHEGRRPDHPEGNLAPTFGPLGIDVEEESFNGCRGHGFP